MLFIIGCVRSTEGVVKFILSVLDLAVNIVTTETWEISSVNKSVKLLEVILFFISLWNIIMFDAQANLQCSFL